jgi:hypothetical protein
MDKLVDAMTEGAAWGIAFGAVMAVSRPLMRSARPLARTAIRNGRTGSAWIAVKAREGRESLSDFYDDMLADDGGKETPQRESRPRRARRTETTEG